MPPLRVLLPVLFAALALAGGPAAGQELPKDHPAGEGTAGDSEQAKQQQEEQEKPPPPSLDDLTGEIEQARREIESGLITNERLVHWRQRLPQIQSRAQTIGTEAQRQVEATRKLMEALGPVPEEGTEPPAIQAQRDQLQDRLDEHLTRVKRAELISAQAQQLLSDLSGEARQRFTSELLRHGPSALQPSTWVTAQRQLLATLARLRSGLLSALEKDTGVANWPLLLAGALALAALALAGSWTVRRRVARRMMARRRQPPSTFERLRAAAIATLYASLVPALIIAAAFAYMDHQGLLQGLLRPVASVAGAAFVLVCIAHGLARAALAVEAPGWRIVPVSDAGAKRLNRLATLTAAVFAADVAIVRIGTVLEAGTALAVVHHLMFAVVITLLLARLVRRDIWSPDASGAHPLYDRLRRVLIPGALAFGLAAIGPALLGYFALSRFVATRVVLTVLWVGILMLLRALGREGINAGLPGMRREAAEGDQSTSLLQFWLGAALDLVIATIGLLIALPLWGVPLAQLQIWLLSAASGFQIGEIHISPFDLLFAVIIFALILAGTRIVQRALETRVLPQTRLDVGVRDSMRTFVGYVGLVIAAVVALSTAGLDFSNLAIVAGALSVGIGFGLQAIVNNFVSGLILLFERPIKVGDWVVVGGQEGTVRRIRVRSTEIDTFDRSTIIVPNSELISTTITNWTHGNRVCRIAIKLRVPYGSDTKQVHDVLLQCAADNPYVLSAPEPYVLFNQFGDSGLHFELRVYARDTDYYLVVLSELHFAVDQALREAGIQIPYPQRDIHVHRAPRREATGPTPSPVQAEPGPESDAE